ncbi:MAG: hypothetical protein GEU82_00845 [Luteitalea sp.]|nr:hypothetical protein [Luteitalea sp.]
MLKRGLVCAAWLAGCAAGTAAQKPARLPVTLQDLTVPQARLPAGCSLAPIAAATDHDVARGGLWAGLPIPTNPWIGTERRLVATIRSRIDGPPRAPDGPPLAGRAASRYFLQSADGVEEAYAAIYRQPEPELIVVYALRFAVAGKDVDRPRYEIGPKVQTAPRIEFGPITVVVSGERGECSYAVESYLRSLDR